MTSTSPPQIEEVSPFVPSSWARPAPSGHCPSYSKSQSGPQVSQEDGLVEVGEMSTPGGPRHVYTHRGDASSQTCTGWCGGVAGAAGKGNTRQGLHTQDSGAQHGVGQRSQAALPPEPGYPSAIQLFCKHKPSTRKTDRRGAAPSQAVVNTCNHTMSLHSRGLMALWHQEHLCVPGMQQELN